MIERKGAPVVCVAIGRSPPRSRIRNVLRIPHTSHRCYVRREISSLRLRAFGARVVSPISRETKSPESRSYARFQRAVPSSRETRISPLRSVSQCSLDTARFLGMLMSVTKFDYETDCGILSLVRVSPLGLKVIFYRDFVTRRMRHIVTSSLSHGFIYIGSGDISHYLALWDTHARLYPKFMLSISSV